MKYILTEEQYKNLLESNKKLNVFQELIDTKLNELRKECDENEDSFSGCYEVDSIEEIKVVDIIHTTKDNSPLIILRIIILFDTFKYKDYVDSVLELNWWLRKSTGLPIKIEYKTENHNKEMNS
jgi:hypothetical protein